MGHSAIHPERTKLNTGILLHRPHHVVGLVGGGFQHGAGNMALVHKAGQTGHHAPRIGFPIGCVQARKSRNKVSSAIVVNGLGEGLHVGTFFNHTEVVAEPLHQRSRDGYTTFEGVGNGFVPKLVGNSCQQTTGRFAEYSTRVEQQEATRTVGVFGLSRLKAGLAHQGRVLIAQDTGQRYTRQHFGGYGSIHLAARPDGGQHGAGYLKSSQ